MTKMAKIARTGLFFCFLILSGCKEVLFSNLDQVEVNQMVTVLQAAGLPSSRNQAADGTYELLVDSSQIGVAVLLLQEEGLPRANYLDLGEVFADTGIVGTPFEERARFMHALNQEFSQTISEIDGVQSARVHVVLPQAERFDRSEQEASAVVAIYHQSEFDALTIVPTVKTMMAHGVPDLNYDNVAVSLFPIGGATLQVRQNSGIISSVEASPVTEANLSLPMERGGNLATLLFFGLLALTSATIFMGTAGVKRLVSGVIRRVKR